jgi:hypothetical protein
MHHAIGKGNIATFLLACKSKIVKCPAKNCGYSSPRPQDINRHYDEAHTEKEICTCRRCKKDFKTKNELRLHNEEMQQ